MNNIDEELITTEAVSFLSKNEVDVQVLRLDKIHPVISGNKWFKLKNHLKNAKGNDKPIVTFGGAFSNHIVATAAACAHFNLQCFGLIRGEEPLTYSHTLHTATQYGMKLIFLSREAYRARRLPEPFNTAAYHVIPEGGYSPEGAAGAATIPYNKEMYDFIACAVGTGTMMAGLINGNMKAQVIGFSALKNHMGLETEVRHLLTDTSQPVNINHQFHFGGYAKHQPDLFKFMNDLFYDTGIPTDFVYTGKMFYGVNELIKAGHFKPGSNILLIHSGGLQGNLSLRKGTLIF